MKILAIDSSAVAASVALCDNDTVLAEHTLLNGNTHSVTLLPMVEEMLKSFEMTVKDLDLFAVSAGPGSFTGVRIGAATLKGLAFGSNTPCIGVSTLSALSWNYPVPNALVVPVMNARRNQFYTALFRIDENGRPNRLTEDQALSCEELTSLLSSYQEPVIFTGDGADLAMRLVDHKFLPTPNRLKPQSAANVALCAYELYQSGVRTTDAELAPTYLRPCQAERERNERLRAEASQTE